MDTPLFDLLKKIFEKGFFNLFMPVVLLQLPRTALNFDILLGSFHRGIGQDWLVSESYDLGSSMRRQSLHFGCSHSHQERWPWSNVDLHIVLSFSAFIFVFVQWILGDLPLFHDTFISLRGFNRRNVRCDGVWHNVRRRWERSGGRCWNTAREHTTQEHGQAHLDTHTALAIADCTNEMEK